MALTPFSTISGKLMGDIGRCGIHGHHFLPLSSLFSCLSLVLPFKALVLLAEIFQYGGEKNTNLIFEASVCCKLLHHLRYSSYA
jgi:hypothetical protein